MTELRRQLPVVRDSVFRPIAQLEVKNVTFQLIFRPYIGCRSLLQHHEFRCHRVSHSRLAQRLACQHGIRPWYASYCGIRCTL